MPEDEQPPVARNDQHVVVRGQRPETCEASEPGFQWTGYVYAAIGSVFCAHLGGKSLPRRAPDPRGVTGGALVRAGRRQTGARQHPCLPLLCRTPSGHVTDTRAVPSRSTSALARLIIILCRDAFDALTFLLLDSPLSRRCRCGPRRRSERDHFRL